MLGSIGKCDGVRAKWFRSLRIAKCNGRILFFLLFLCLAEIASAQNCSQIANSRVMVGDYKLGFSTIDPNKPKAIFLQVSLKKENFKKAYLLNIVEKLRSKYCNYDWVSVVLFDNEKESRDPARSMDILVNSKQTIFLMRGFYNLDRTTGKEGLEYSIEPGGSTRQVEILLKEGKPID